MPDSSAVPTAPLATGLGYLALIPFAVGATLVWSSNPDVHDLAARGLAAYAAVVVSFIGGIHWGLAFTRPSPSPRSFVWGVIPALIAWPALLMRLPIGLAVVAVTLVACYLVDRWAYVEAGVAAWLPLRLRLTIVATICCVVGAVGS